MGLDMYAYAVKALPPDKQVDFKLQPEDIVDDNLAYWRKVNALHGWMHRLYIRKGGSSKDFNCCNMQLGIADLDELEADMRENKLKPVDGFFFGSQEFYEQDKQSVYDFIAKARDHIDAGRSVVYHAWF